MKISYNWLKELLPDLTQTPGEVAELLTRHSFETEVTQQWKIDPAIRIVQISTIEPHPNADRLRLATVTDGKEKIRVVCGAPNIGVQQLVPYAPPGAVVLDAEGRPFTLQEATIRGEVSPGMLASPRELGLGADHGGILVLFDDAPLGAALIDHLPNDTILEADISPNRAHDCLSHLGIAREIAALLGIDVRHPDTIELPSAQPSVHEYTVAVADKAATPLYMNLVVTGVRNTRSPLWLQARLYAAGLRPINTIVDITNYVMLEVGNPSHAFDANRLPGKTTGVRTARPGEEIELLDGSRITAPSGSLVITSNDSAVALAGVMGGAGTEVSPDTTELVVEVASFQAYTIQQTAAQLNLRTEASHRFAKGIDPSVADLAAARLAHLFQAVAGGTVQGLVEERGRDLPPAMLSFRPAKASALAGTVIKAATAKQALERLQFTVDDTDTEVWQVRAPAYRLDVTTEPDVAEEVIRFVGLEQIPAAELPAPAKPPEQPSAVKWREAIRDVLVQHGFTESYNQPFEPRELAQTLELSEHKLEVANPISPEQAHLRTSLLPGLLRNLKTNKDDFHKKFSTQERALFEIGHIYRAGPKGIVPGIEEEEHIAAVLVGAAHQAREIVQAIFNAVGATIDESLIVFEGTLPAAAQNVIKYRVPVAALEINLTKLVRQAKEVKWPVLTLEELQQPGEAPAQFTEFSRYPSILRDISLLVAPTVAVETVQEIIERVGGPLVVDTDLFDEWQPAGGEAKSLAFHIEYQSLQKTLTEEDIAPIHDSLIKALKSELNAEIR